MKAVPQSDERRTTSPCWPHVEELLSRHGLRRTAQRIAVLEVLSQQDNRHLSAAEIHESLVAGGADVDLATVYRTITTMANLGIVHATARTEQSTSYGLTADPHHHAVCTRCGTVEDLSADALSEAIDIVQQSTSFRLSSSVVTVQGVCGACQTT